MRIHGKICLVTNDEQHTKSALMQYANNADPDQPVQTGLRCLLTESMGTLVYMYVDKQRIYIVYADNQGKPRSDCMLIWTFTVRLWHKSPFLLIAHQIL